MGGCADIRVFGMAIAPAVIRGPRRRPCRVSGDGGGMKLFFGVFALLKGNAGNIESATLFDPKI
jgi:hypothetical protein